MAEKVKGVEIDPVREKLIELMHSADFECIKIECNKCNHFNAPKHNGIPACKEHRIADFLIANGVTFATDNNVGGKWIPVTERLPEMPGKYLVTGRSFRDKIPQIWICECISVGFMIGWCNDARNPVIEAWMPLPEPPKGE